MLGFTERRDIMKNYFKALFGIILALAIGTIPLWVKVEYNGTEIVFIMVATLIGIPSFMVYFIEVGRNLINEMFK